MTTRILSATVKVPLSAFHMGALEIVQDYDAGLYRLRLFDDRGELLEEFEDLSADEYRAVLRGFYAPEKEVSNR